MLNRAVTKTAQERQMRVCAWAASIVSRPFVVLDTETTGLEQDAEVVEIAIVGRDGKPLLDTLIKPQRPIPAKATAVHGITNEMVLTAPVFNQVYPRFIEIVSSIPEVIIYNAQYDVARLRYMTHQCHLPVLEMETSCLMLQYATYWGEPGWRPGDFRWQGLETACQQQGIADTQRHRALDDAQQTWRLLRHLAAKAQMQQQKGVQA